MRGPKQHRRSLAAAVIALVVSGGVVVSCTDDEPSAGQDPTERLVGIYAATVSAIVDEAGPTRSDSGDADADRTVFLQAHEETAISAEVQVGVVNELDEWANVRFIDDPGEAISDEDGAPVRDDGVLIWLGAVSDGEVDAELVADRYMSADETYVYDVAVRRQGGEWNVEQPLDGVRVRNP